MVTKQNTRNTRRKSDKRRNSKESAVSVAPSLRLLRGVCAGTLIAMLCGGALLLLLAGILCAQPDPDALLYPASLLTLGFASLLCGLCTVRISGCSVFASGLASVASWFLVTLLLSQLFRGEIGGFSSVYGIALRVAAMLLTFFGVFLGRERPRKVTHRPHGRSK